jgi:hypothetical protein
MQDRFSEGGAQGVKPQRYAPIFVAASLTGLYTQRNNFHDPSNIVTQRFYGGRPDTLYNGINVELSNELTMIRRFGTVAVSANYAQPPDNAFQWELDDGTIMLIVDTAGFVYNEPLNGAAAAPIFTKTAGAGRGYFVASGDTLYYGDGIDVIKYTPTNPNGLTWNWGIAAPSLAPQVTPVATGSSATQWAANTVFSTMGLIVDPNGNAQQLSGVNANPAVPNATQIGLSGSGTPNFNTAYLATTTDGTVTWSSLGQITLWEPNTTYQPGNAIYDPGTNCIFISSHGHPVTSGNKRPLFNATLGLTGARVNDGSQARWENIGYVGQAAGAVRQWTKNTAFALYQLPASGGDPTNANSAIVWPLAPFISADGQLCNGQPIYLLGATAGTTANATTSPWAGIPSQTLGQITTDNQLAWTCLGSATWAPNTGVIAWGLGNSTFSVVKDQNGNLQVAVGSGSTGILEPGSMDTLTAASNASGGNTTYTGTFPIPFPANFIASITGFTNAANNGLFVVVSCNSTTLVVANPSGVAETHSGTATFDPWSGVYGGQTIDGTVTWVCVGNSLSWTAATNWFLPATGFQPPLATQAFGGAEVIGSAFVQAVIASGLSGGSAPAWSVTIGGLTTDNAITWETVSAFSAVGIAWTKGHVYAYSFKCRTATDPYVTTSLLTFGGLNTPTALLPLGNVPGLTAPLGAFLGGGTGAVSSTSPVFTLSGPNVGAVNTVKGFGSTDPQVDTIVIWRDADGGGPANMFELIEIPAPRPVAGMAQPWIFYDFVPDVATTVAGINYPGLDVLEPAPIDGQNDPPPAGFLPLCDELHFSRIWGAVGNTVFHSSGPDNIVGNGNESFNAANNDFPFKSTVIACIHTPSGLLCPTSTDWECIYGGPSTASFYSMTPIRGVGLLTYTAWDRIGGEIYFISPDCQLWSLNPTVQDRAGFPIGNLLSRMLPANGPNVSVAAHENGTDNAIYVGDGATGWFRLNPHQVGADTAGENALVWSPFAEIAAAGGAQLLKSVLTPGNSSTVAPFRQLIIGPSVPGNPILARSLNVFKDNETPYDQCWFDIGSVTMVYPGQRAAVKFIEFDFMPGATGGIQLTQFGKNQAFGGAQVTFPVTPGRIVVLVAIGRGSQGAFGVVDTLGICPGGIPNAYGGILDVATGFWNNFSMYAYPTGTHSGPCTFTVSSLQSFKGTALFAYEFEGTATAVDGFGRIVTEATAQNTGTNSVPGTVNAGTMVGNAGDLIMVASMALENGQTVHVAGGGGYTSDGTEFFIDADNGVSNDLNCAHQIPTGAGPFPTNFVLSGSGEWGVVGMSIAKGPPCAASNPDVYYALDDPTDDPTWVALANFYWDPPVKYGGLGITPPYLPERFYLNQNADVAIGRRIRVKVDFGSNPCNGRDELISWAIFGKKYTEE